LRLCDFLSFTGGFVKDFHILCRILGKKQKRVDVFRRRLSGKDTLWRREKFFV